MSTGGGTDGTAGTALAEQARAKVNLTLRVLGRRPDGYHELESVVAFAGVADRLTLTPGAKAELTVTGPRAAECGALDDNLVFRAARALGARIEGLRSGQFTLDKQLPAAAGIGGGSADAAAALRLLAASNNIAFDDPRIMAVARATGADIPVCVASKACVMTGVGETLAPITLPPLPCVLVNPRVPVATRDVFAELGLKPGEFRAGLSEVLEAVAWPAPGAAAEDWIDALAGGSNDLEAPAIRVQPAIAQVLAVLRAAEGVRLARMSGSGATCFAIFSSETEARAAAAAIAAGHPGWWVEASVLN
ncbi:4-(cytidine 5'-diphospho)-2-C-methyl-D-erythritol kinase [Bradyrhizobium sp. WD16]|uniref:4-(cytidine 5'-diphospho)-2-C-methyl-D-erythritol kinase n=1 Tax=Bradyrhizobium sp. WD16 TaxID=1521768 RepID=UPI0020A40FF4|nr:4-(cytidine 5'-diphospho)-2-C-methyl-D-erythritol kinase [Bradyrhizobium sp. WD16]UTD25826.1 4-(cytidine 5'-diphospho)-2-C-methyl-D-erythritol kinase [Bradyrhizobium sp. WD16]